MRVPASHPHCLVVEDEALVGMDVEDALSEAGFAVHWVASPEGASAALAATQPDVVVLDVVLRARMCTDLVRDIRRRGIPIVVHSGYTASGVPGEFDGVPWLRKPADMPVLLAAVEAALPRREAHTGAVTA
jgi:DNA-binding response OmpR family regulator